MNDTNPYEGPTADEATEPAKPLKTVGTLVLLVGVLVLAYGAVASFVLPNLPPNAPSSGRLNSIYVMGIGAVVSIAGLVLRDFRLRGGKKSSDGR